MELLNHKPYRLIASSSHIAQEGIFTPMFLIDHPEYRVNCFIQGRWYEEPFDEDALFADLREDEYPEFVALDMYPQCIAQVFTPEYTKEKHLHWLKLKQFELE